MITVDIEYQVNAQDSLAHFLKKTARSIEKGYGAGNCTPESEAFWTLYPKTSLSAGWRLIRIELDADDLTKHEIGTAVRKVGPQDEGEIVVFGQKVGRWYHPTDLPENENGLIAS